MLNNAQENLHKTEMAEMMLEGALVSARSYEKFKDERFKKYMDYFHDQFKLWKDATNK